MGVAFFFVISGFLLYRPFLAARFAGPPARRAIRDYARRRVLRIVPAYWVALTVLAATVGLCGVFTGDWWVYYGFLQNTRLSTTLCGIGAAWSLAIEASFYVALPLWALLMARLQRGRPARTMVRIEVAALLAISLVSIVVAHRSPSPCTGPRAASTSCCSATPTGSPTAWASRSPRWRCAGRERESRVVRVISDHAWLPWALAAFLWWLDATQLGHEPHACRRPTTAAAGWPSI